MKYLIYLLLTLQFLFATTNETNEAAIFSNNESIENKIEITSEDKLNQNFTKETETTSEDKLNQNISNDNEEDTASVEETINDLENSNRNINQVTAPMDYFEEVDVSFLSLENKSIYPKFTVHPKNIYQKQTFEVVIKTIVATQDFTQLQTRFINSKNITVVNPDSIWREVGNQEYENRFYIKVNSSNFVMPTFQIIAYDDYEIRDVAYLKPKETTFLRLAKGNNKFSGVIANELKVTNFKTRQYNNKELLTVIEIYAVNGNLEDFKLDFLEHEQGISSFEESYPLQNLIYYTVIPIHNKKIVFNYYNVLKKKFEDIIIPINLEDDLVSTQTDLNPNNSNFEFYKKIAISVITLLFLIITIIRRKIIYLIITLLLFIIFIMFMMPNKTYVINKDIKVFILPTSNSTIFLKTSKQELVEVLIQKNGYMKIMFKNGSIGWIKEEDVSKN